MSTQAHVESATHKYLEHLKRQAAGARPISGLHWGHLLAGGLICFALSLCCGLWSLTHGSFNWWLASAAGLAGALLNAVLARQEWNALLKAHLDSLRALTRTNLLEHDLLLLCMEEDLPAKFEALRTVSQSYGKTRARNWTELKRGSMRERLQWLVENYNVICTTLKMPFLTEPLLRLQKRLFWLNLSPLLLLIASMVLPFLKLGLAHPVLVTCVLYGMGLATLVSLLFLMPLTLLVNLQRAALLGELVTALDRGESG